MESAETRIRKFRAEIARLRGNPAKLAAVLLAGRQMSNICFNLSQRQPGSHLSAGEMKLMRDAQETWDEAAARVRK